MIANRGLQGSVTTAAAAEGSPQRKYHWMTVSYLNIILLGFVYKRGQSVLYTDPLQDR